MKIFFRGIIILLLIFNIVVAVQYESAPTQEEIDAAKQTRSNEMQKQKKQTKQNSESQEIPKYSDEEIRNSVREYKELRERMLEAMKQEKLLQ
ncbi:MAG: hypothetical protein LUC34_05330 [Campylobacter sp.]|nr:hypothetical protein [Campylobacter sp.]